MRPHPRRARTDTTHPEAWATDDRSGFIGNHGDLQWQYDYAGTQLINKRILVYSDMLDIPQRQLGTIILPPDPTPIINARPENYPIDEVWPRIMELGTSPHDEVPRYLETSTAPGTHGTIARALEISTEP